jgi:PAS domain S-box-containing protein
LIRAGFGGDVAAEDDRQLERSARKQQAVASLGLRALGRGNLQELMDTAVNLVADALDVELAKVLELLPDRATLLLRAGVGWQDGLVGQAKVDTDRDSQAGYTLLSHEPIVVEDLRSETRFNGPALLTDHGVVSGISVIIHGASRPWGVLGVHTASRRQFDADDVDFVQSVANVLAAAIDRALAEDALSESEARFRTLVEMAPDAIFSISVSDGTFTSLSPAFERLTGWSRAEWLGRSFVEILKPEDLPKALECFASVQTGTSPPPFELRVRSRDGGEIVGEFRLTPQIEGDEVVELFGIARDVSDRRRAEEELRRSRDELEIILRGVADGITVQDTHGRLIYANEMAARLTGCGSVEELLATPPAELLARFEMFTEEGEPFPLDRLPGRLALQGKPAPETIMRSRDDDTGDDRWTVISATPVLDPNGQPRYAINIFHDITESKRIERVQRFLAEATALLSETLDYEQMLGQVARIAVPFLADLCVFDIVQPDGTLRRSAAHADPETERLIYDLITRHPVEPTHPVMRAINDGEVTLYAQLEPQSVEESGLTNERVEVIAALGFRSVIVVPLSARGRQIGALSLMFAESGRRYTDSHLAVALELARRAATAVDNALLFHKSQQAAARLRVLAEASHALAEASLDLQAVLDAVAHSAGELIGDQCILRLLSEDGMFLPAAAVYHPDPERREHLVDFLQREVQRADEGLVGSVITTGQPVFIPSIEPDALRRAVTAGHREDVARVPLYSIAIVLVSVGDRPIGTLGLGRERPGEPYTEEDLLLLQELADRSGLAIENARLYREARDAARSREQFLSIASHELKTPLTSIKASAQLLDRRLKQDPIDRSRIEPLLSQVQSELNRLENLVLDLLDATRIQQGRLELRWEDVDLVELARQAIERFESAAQGPPGHALVLLADGPVEARVDPDRIDQVVTNLVSNALKYSPDGGKVDVVVRASGGAAEIAVTDRGIGISADELATLFQPFARGDFARQSIGGTGLGLFISAEIVERHGGTIAVDSTPGQGSTFTVYLPVEPADDVTAS